MTEWVLRMIAFWRMRLRGEADGDFQAGSWGFFGEDFGEGTVALIGEGFAEVIGETGGVLMREAVKDAMAEHAPRAHEGGIDVGGAAVDGADDLEAEEVGEHAVGEVQDGADLIAIVCATGHECGIRVLKDHDKVFVLKSAALVRPKADELGIGKHCERSVGNEVKAVGVFQLAYEVAEVGGLAGAGGAFQ